MINLKLRGLLILLSLVCYVHGFGQSSGFFFTETKGPIFLDENSEVLRNPTAGGLQFPILANMDLDGDGVLDLIVQDQKDKSTRTFIGNGKVGSPAYDYRPEYEGLLPTLGSWVITRDFDGDGLLDIFTHDNGGGFLIYKNTTEKGELEFTLFKKFFEYFDPNPEYNDIYGLTVVPEIPAISDINGDGDMDLLTFNSGRVKIYYLENQSMEKYGHADSIDYLLATECWGYFEESESDHSIREKDCYHVRSNKKKDGGSNLLTIDLDGDKDQDLLLSHYLYTSVLALENGKYKNEVDTVIGFKSNFPNNTQSIDIELFPSMSLVDANFDGKPDLICAPSSIKDTLVVENNWLYQNVSTNDTVKFEFITKSFLHDDMLDYGKKAIPAFYDFDSDGDLDLFVASSEPVGIKTGLKSHYRVFRYENTGDAEQAVYELVDEDFLGLKSLNMTYAFPAFGDADNNGTIDLVLGTETGKLIFFSNQNPVGQPASFSPGRRRFMEIDVGNSATPNIVDVNGDNKNDLLIGNQSGKVHFYQWASDSMVLETDSWGGVELTLPCAPFFGDFDHDGKNELLLGANDGMLHFADDVDYQDPKIELEQKIIQNDLMGQQIEKDFGAKLSLAVADLNGDTLQDILMGTEAGGLIYLEGGEHLIYVGILDKPSDFEFSIFPNPVANQITLRWNKKINGAQTRVFDMKGTEVINASVANGEVLNTAHLPKGTYALLLYGNEGQVGAQKFVKH